MRFFFITFVSGILFTQTSFAADIQTSGDSGTSYTIQCKNEVGMKFNFEGTVPKLHVISTSRLPDECSVKKDATSGKLVVVFNIQNNQAATVAPTNLYTMTLSNPNETQIVKFTASPTPAATPPMTKGQMRRHGANLSTPLGH